MQYLRTLAIKYQYFNFKRQQNVILTYTNKKVLTIGLFKYVV